MATLTCIRTSYGFLQNGPVYGKVGASSSVVDKALYYKPEGRGFETRWGELIFSIYLILPAALSPGIDSASNKNEYQKQKNNVFEMQSETGA
jgi:hypothetical protein